MSELDTDGIAPPGSLSIKINPEPKWEWCLNGRWNEIAFRQLTAPNRLHRWAQRLLLGIHWRRIEK